MQIGIVVGLRAEARIARRIGRAVAGGGTPVGAEQAALRLAHENVRALLSFGLAGGLDPTLRPGTIVIPRAVLSGGERFGVDPELLRRLGGPTADLVLGEGEIAASDARKRQLWQQTRASAVDTESGAVARVARSHGVPFAVLRAVCDPAERSLPPAVLVALDRAGTIRFLTVLASVAATPSQLPELLQLARDAAIARQALTRRVAALDQRLAGA
jgi:adenosylhomocysteine nucleosidase